MNLSQFIHKIIAVSLVRQATQQYKTTRQDTDWEHVIHYARQHIHCPTFLSWVERHAQKKEEGIQPDVLKNK